MDPKQRKELEERSMNANIQRESKQVITLGGTAINQSGRLTKTNFFRFLGHNLDDYEDVALSKEEALKIHNHLLKLSTGSTAMVPMYCGGERCPFRDRCPLFQMGKHPLGKQCHPAGTLVYTTDGYKPIETLDPEKDRIVSYANSCGLFRKQGRKFSVGTREYTGQMFFINTVDGTGAYHCTPDHICVATWNAQAKDLFAVYLMQKGDFFRVGKVQLFRKTGDKQYFGLSSRAQQEQCDKIWILGVYETNTEALLQEEFFSVTWQIPKACFVNRPCYAKAKQGGLYKWVTQEQLDQHHASLLKPLCYYAERLDQHGLSIHYPFWDRSANYRQLGSIGKTFEIRACNLLSGYMDMLVFNDEQFQESLGTPALENRATLHTIEVKKSEQVTRLVYSLDVEKEHTYVTGGLVTHNCLMEVQLMKEWIMRYFEEYDVDPNNFTEVAYINELAEIEILLMRINMNIAKPENAELVVDQVVGIANDGQTPLLMKQVSPFMELKDKLQARRSKVVKLMVGDRQEQYKKEAALKVKLDKDPSSKQAEMRAKLEALSRELDNFNQEGRGQELSPRRNASLSPEDIIDSKEDDHLT